ncbi:hypothetical protein imdm_198 [gamma proteobacterium IMCC2047]|nr:hypothetical protein imdm_198 [gamma proteobacterium IMCC2047]
MRRKNKAINSLKQAILINASLSLFLSATTSSADPFYTPTTLNLSLPSHYTAPPPQGMQHDLNISSNIHHGALGNLTLSKKRKLPLGLKRIKVDKTMKVRGWTIKENIHVGHTRVGKEWGIGMMMTSGNFAYGLNNKGVGMTYKTENSRYRINMQEVSMKIDF